MDDFIIILPTHSKYLKVVKNFLQLLCKNWNECKYKIIISVTGDNEIIEGFETIYNGCNSSLIDCVVNASKKYYSKYYMVFLGDAFIYKKINNHLVSNLLLDVVNDNIQYCSINCIRKYKKELKYNNFLRYINKQDNYSHNFVAFIANYSYINSTFKKFKTDLDFEKYYLDSKEKGYYSDHLMIRKNYFNILPSINKGKWDKINYFKLKRYNPEINFANLKIQTWIQSIIYHLIIILKHVLPNGLIYISKKILSKITKKKFVSKR